MGISSSNITAQELVEFRKVNTSLENVEIPARPESRSVTDKKGFVIYGIVIIIFLPFFIYALVKSDIRRMTHGFDDCGNLCGVNNTKIEGIECSGIDYTNLPFMKDGDIKDIPGTEYAYQQTHCVRSCPQGSSFGVCIEAEKFDRDIWTSDSYPYRSRRTGRAADIDHDEQGVQNAFTYCRRSWWKFVISIIMTIALCFILLLLLRFAPAILVWGILIFSLLIGVILTGFSWYSYSQVNSAKENASGVLGAAIVITIITIIAFIIVMVLFKKIGLVIILYKEATKAVFAMPGLLFIPVLIAIVQLIVLACFIISTVWMTTSANLEKLAEDAYSYEKNGVMIFSIVFNVVMTSWTMQFIAGIQCMIIAGSIASWYFAKNKQYLDSPIGTSFSNTFRFHIGTLAFGSFILTLVAIIKAIIKSLIKNEKTKFIVSCCLDNVEAFLKFLSKNAYIESAIHGQSFFRSGRRGAKLLLANVSSTIAINSVGDFVLGMAQFILLVVSTGISYAVFSSAPGLAWLPTIICFIVNIFIIAITFAIFETTIDTLFLCFCEDKLINDGMSRPYYMSRGLMEFVENSKKIYDGKSYSE